MNNLTDNDDYIRKMVEERLRQGLRARKSETIPPKTVVNYEPPSSPEPSFKSPKPLIVEKFIDDTIADISTPDNTEKSESSAKEQIIMPVIEPEFDTLEQIIVKEESFKDDSFSPLPQVNLNYKMPEIY